MFQLDDQFLKDVGLDLLPEDQRQAFLQHIYDELEIRVGTRLSDGLSDEQLEEFESIIDKKEEVIVTWLQQHAPSYQQEEAYSKLQQATGYQPGDVNLRNEYAATKWLEVNRPDYRDVVAKTLEELKQEIIQNRETILGGTANTPPSPPVEPVAG